MFWDSITLLVFILLFREIAMAVMLKRSRDKGKVQGRHFQVGAPNVFVTCPKCKRKLWITKQDLSPVAVDVVSPLVPPHECGSHNHIELENHVESI